MALRVHARARVLPPVLGPLYGPHLTASSLGRPRTPQAGSPDAGSLLVFSALLLRCPDPAHADAANPLNRALSLRDVGWVVNPHRRSSRTLTGMYYGGGTTLSFFSQMAASLPNFVSAAGLHRRGLRPDPGIAAGRTGAKPGLGTLHDLTRALLYVLLPISVIAPWSRLVSRRACRSTPGSGGLAGDHQGAGTNGGRGAFFNVNILECRSRNSTLTNFIEMLCDARHPASLTFRYPHGRQARRHGGTISSSLDVRLCSRKNSPLGSTVL